MIAARRPTGPDGVERRLAPRLEPDELSEPVLVVGSRLVNIGPEGLMLEAPVPLAPESTLHLRLVLGGERADVDARVRGCVPRSHGRGRAWGVGVEFENLDPAARERLDRALAAPEEGPGLARPRPMRGPVPGLRVREAARPLERVLPGVPHARGRVRAAHVRGGRRAEPGAGPGIAGEAQDRPGQLALSSVTSARTTASSGRSAWCSRSETTVARPWASTRRSAAEVSRAVG